MSLKLFTRVKSKLRFGSNLNLFSISSSPDFVAVSVALQAELCFETELAASYVSDFVLSLL